MPYGGDLITGLTNLLYEVAMPQPNDTARNPSAPETNVSKAYLALKNSIHTISFHRAITVARNPGRDWDEEQTRHDPVKNRRSYATPRRQR